jgi:integrase
MPGSGSVYRERGRWIAQLAIGPRGQQLKIRRTRVTRAEAQAALAELREQRRPPSATKLTVGAYLERWVADVRNLRPATRHAYANAIDYHLSPAIGSIRLADLSPLHVESMLASVGETVSPKTLRNVHAVLRRALAMAVRAGLLTRNVASREFVDAPRVPVEEPRALSLAEVHRLLAVVRGDRLEALFVLAIGTGLRQGELLGLAWEDVELSALVPALPGSSGTGGGSRVNVRRELVRRNGRYFRDELKTRTSRRAVPLSAAVVAALAAHRERVIAAGFVPTATGPLFTNLRGGPLNGGWVTHRFYALLAEAKITPRLPFHNLRTTYASTLAEAGVPEVQIARLLGHAQTTTTRKHYIQAGVLPPAVLETVERMVG